MWRRNERFGLILWLVYHTCERKASYFSPFAVQKRKNEHDKNAHRPAFFKKKAGGLLWVVFGGGRRRG